MSNRVVVLGTGGGVSTLFGLGVFWCAWGKVGFWWAFVYGLFWPAWLGHAVAERLL